MAAPKTGVINANILMTKNSVIDKKGIKTRLLRKPGAESVRRVINKLVKDIVVLTPDKITLIIAMSCAPKPVKRVLLEKGVINVHPAMVKVELLDLGNDFFLNLLALSCVVKNHKESDALLRLVKIKFLMEVSK